MQSITEEVKGEASEKKTDLVDEEELEIQV